MDSVLPRLHVVTDVRPGRSPLDVVAAAVAAARSLDNAAELAIQVRVEDDVTDREAYELTLAVLGICRPAEVLCLVNDRLHIAVGAGADGGHVGADDLPVAAARRVLGAGVLGATCREGGAAVAAVADGATYLGVGPAFGTLTKGGLPDPIGPDGIAAVARAVPGTPVIAIGGVGVGSVPVLLEAGAHGVAVVSAVSDRADPGRAVGDLLRALGTAGGPTAGRGAGVGGVTA